MNLGIECPRYRASEFIRAANPRRDERVTCARCGAEFRYGELEDRAAQSARELLARVFPTMQLD